MKRIISLTLCIAMLFSISISAFAIDFSDFNSSHWAYSYVNALVNDGTINGFEDGTFRPEATVTRAQFVKMIGNGPETREQPFDDVAPTHWAYGYIMTSGLKPLTDNMFMPDTPITRGDVAELLWQRAGSPKGITAPPIVHRQSSNFDAASWVYTNGIMVGDDYIDLRLDDTLTRAEASALIIRSREVNDSTPKTDFASMIDQSIYEKVYNAFYLIDRPYDANATVTNGELAMAAARLQSGMDVPMYPNLSAEVTFEHKYAQPINMLCRYYLGLENDNAAYADKNATMKEAIAALMFVTSRSATSYIPMGKDSNYPNYKSSGNKTFDQYISNAYANGILSYEAPTLNMDADITMKDLALLALEFDGFSGFHRIVRITPKGSELKNAKIRVNAAAYPANSSDYRIITENLPNYVYETPFVSAISAPEDSYNMTNSFRSIYTSMLSTWVVSLSNVGYKLEVDYFPGVAVNNGNGETLRCSIKFTEIPANTKLGTIINCNAADAELIINTGDTVYADISTGKEVDSLVLGIDSMVLDQIIK